MIKATLKDGKEVVLIFRHDMKVDEFHVPNTQRATAKGYTQCEIVSGPKENQLLEGFGEGYYSSSEKIPYSREVGRQQALKRAILSFDSEDQGRLLQAYFNRPRPRDLASSVQREKPIINTDY